MSVEFKTLKDPANIKAGNPVCWINKQRDVSALERGAFRISDVTAAGENWAWFAPLVAEIFPETSAAGGLISSELRSVASALPRQSDWLVKCDHALPGTGSIKARGGVYEVLMRAKHDLGETGFSFKSSLAMLSPQAREQFSKRRILVGSTGNLGFSVGITARYLGYQVDVHMSRDAKQWKKDRLTRLGARVIEHSDDYSHAVAMARTDAANDPDSYFVDDENSPTLFLGYSAAALELAGQLKSQGISIGDDTPLEVYLPCGVGGAPGGVAFGLSTLFGNAVRPILVEPVASPCMLAQLMQEGDRPVSVYDFGLDNRTAADGLAVTKVSMLVAQEMKHIAAASVTVSDDELFVWAVRMWETAGLRLEPSGASGFAACAHHSESLLRSFDGCEPVRVIWTTGGALLPDAEFEAILQRGKAVENKLHTTTGG